MHLTPKCTQSRKKLDIDTPLKVVESVYVINAEKRIGTPAPVQSDAKVGTMALKKNTGGLVFSSGQGRMCPGCSQPIKACTCARKQPTLTPDGVVRVSRQTKGRNGKGVTLITGIPLDEAGIKALATRLKQRCGSGGTVKDGIIEIQGDHRDLLVEELMKQGWTVKRAGG